MGFLDGPPQYLLFSTDLVAGTTVDLRRTVTSGKSSVVSVLYLSVRVGVGSRLGVVTRLFGLEGPETSLHTII